MKKVAEPPLIVLADDHEDTRDMYLQFLTEKGFRVATASDGMKALALTRRLRPAVVVLDVRMPKLDGLGVLRRIRRLREAGDVPVLVLTAYDHFETDALAAGATAVCVKPCAPETLLRQLRALSRRRHQD